MRVPELAVPKSYSELFETDPDALLVRPFMTGDLFVGMEANGERVDLVIAGHPCVIRGSGGKLMTRVPCCLIKPSTRPLEFENWPDGTFDHFPIPAEMGLGDPAAVRLLEWASVHKREFLRAKRRAALTERGIYIFQQRFTHALTRVAIPLGDYEAASKAVVREAALEEDWVDELAADQNDEREIAGLVKAFHAFLDEPQDAPAEDVSVTDGGRPSRRSLLRDPGGESALTKLLRAEMRQRKKTN